MYVYSELLVYSDHIKSCLRADEVPEKGMKNIYLYAKVIVKQKKDSCMVHDDIREEYLQSNIHVLDQLVPI